MQFLMTPARPTNTYTPAPLLQSIHNLHNFVKGPKASPSENMHSEAVVFGSADGRDLYWDRHGVWSFSRSALQQPSVLVHCSVSHLYNLFSLFVCHFLMKDFSLC